MTQDSKAAWLVAQAPFPDGCTKAGKGGDWDRITNSYGSCDDLDTSLIVSLSNGTMCESEGPENLMVVRSPPDKGVLCAMCVICMI